MKVINYLNNNADPNYHLLASNHETGIKKKLIENYSVKSEKEYYQKVVTVISRQLPFILENLNGNLNGKVILDLGCGAKNCRDNDYGNYEPWLCRTLHLLEVKVIGVDVDDSLSKESFVNHVVDLFSSNSLAMIESNSVDLVHASSLFDSVAVVEKSGFSAIDKFKQTLMPEIKRVLKKDGVFLYG